MPTFQFFELLSSLVCFFELSLRQLAAALRRRLLKVVDATLLVRPANLPMFDEVIPRRLKRSEFFRLQNVPLDPRDRAFGPLALLDTPHMNL